jgi:tetratricopeptide (TPR) repeat protein
MTNPVLNCCFWIFLGLATIAPFGAASAQDDRTHCFSVGSDDYKKKGDTFESEIAACTRLIGIRTGPQLANAYRARGYWFQRRGDLKSALTDADQAVKIDPKFMENYQNRGEVLLDMGDLERALADFRQAQRLDSTFALSYRFIGKVYEMQGTIDLAKQNYEACLKARSSKRDPGAARLQQWAQSECRLRLDVLAKSG